MIRPIRSVFREPDWERPPSLSVSRTSPVVARSAVNIPSPTATAAESKNRFGKELADKASAVSAEGSADGELTLSDRSLREQQIRYVRTRDEQKASDRCEEN